jgi:hypothetical protein
MSDKPVEANKFFGAPESVNRNRIAPPSVPAVRQRDRDLGQTFVNRGGRSRLDAIDLRIGFTDRAVLPGARGAELFLQIFEVRGSPRLDDGGTPGFAGIFDRMRSPELDDFLEGETFESLAVVRGGFLPDSAGPGWYLRLSLTGEYAPRLEPGGHYAFLLGFVERAAGRSMSLANAYYGSYAPDPSRPLIGHGLRREGGSGPEGPPEFRPDLPDDFSARTALPPGTLGFPDVCTWRDLYWWTFGR